jgi:sialate O-acetylesterase
VGKRLALLALKHTYNKDVAADSPVMTKWSVEGNKFVLDFKNVKNFTSKGVPQNFEVAGLAGKWYPAQVKFEGSRIIVWSDEVQKPRMLQYMWHHTRTGNIYNEAGLPLGAFRCSRVENIDAQEVFAELESGFKLIYVHDMLKVLPKDGSIKYVADNSAHYGENIDSLIEQARNNMERAAKSLDFMAAARYRDRMYELQQIKEEQLKNSYQ